MPQMMYGAVPANGLSVVVAEAQRTLREALCAYLTQQAAVAVVTPARDGDEAVRACRVGADVLLLDSSLGPDVTATEVLEALRNLRVPVPVLVFGSASDLDAAASALALGAFGYSTKNTRPASLRDAMIAVAARRIVVPDELERRLIDRLRQQQRRAQRASAILGQLTPREHEVLRLLGLGHNRAQIAERLGVSPHTARTHVSRVMAKLGVNNQIAATARARELYDAVRYRDLGETSPVIAALGSGARLTHTGGEVDDAVAG